MSSAVIFRPVMDSLALQPVWQFNCSLDSQNNFSLRGGSVNELKNGNILICMGVINRTFEVTRNKRLVWSAVTEKYDTAGLIWSTFSLYRAHFTSSLYPCYFTVLGFPDNLDAEGNSLNLSIFNNGDQADSYNVNVSSPDGAYNYHYATGPLAAGKKTPVQINPGKTPVGTTQVMVTVTVNYKPRPAKGLLCAI